MLAHSAAKVVDEKKDYRKDGRFRHQKGSHGQKDVKMMAVQAQPEKKNGENPRANQEKGNAGGPGPKGNHLQKQPARNKKGTKPRTKKMERLRKLQHHGCSTV